MQRMIARRRASMSIGAGTDLVIWGIPLPSGTRVSRVSGPMSVQANALADWDEVAGYGCEAWVLPVQDPDAVTGFDTLWDALVPKDSDVQTLDLDTQAADGTPFYEPGEVDWSQMLKIGLRPKRVFSRYKNFTGASAGITPILDTTLKWVPTDRWQMNIGGFSVSKPSLLVCSIASPSMDDTTVTQQSTLAEGQWGQIKYVTHTLEQAMLNLLGLTVAAQEATATSSFELATDLLQAYLEPDIVETASISWENNTWLAFADMKIHLTVPGSFERITVDTGR